MGPSQYTLARRLLDGEALRVFNEKASEVGAEMVIHLEQCLNTVTENVFLSNALRDQKRFIRHFLFKPHEVSIKEFKTRLHELNSQLEFYPPFNGAAQKLEEDAIKEVLEFAIPRRWEKAMLLQGFIPSLRTTIEFVEFCERLELAEKMTEQSLGTKSHTSRKESGEKKGQTGSKTSEGGQQHNKKRQRGRETSKWCPLHQTNTHDMSECNVMLNQAEKMREAYSNRSTAQRKQKRQKSHKEMMTFVNSVVDKKVNTFVRSLKKRKSRDESEDGSDKESDGYLWDQFSFADLSLCDSKKDDGQDSD